METTKFSEQDLQAQRDRFITTLGHDLKNPIIAQIKGLELLLNGCFGEISNEQKEILQMLLDSSRYVNGMLASLLVTYKNCNGVLKLNIEDFSLVELVNECLSEMLYVAKEKGINISFNINSTIETIQADRVQLKRVIMNLLSNGIKYAFRNTELNLQTFSLKNEIGFKFINQSPYIPIDKQECIFEQYISFTNNHQERGIGLGLYASKKIIEAHCGEIFVESFKENRNSFGFRIPILQNDIISDKLVQF